MHENNPKKERNIAKTPSLCKSHGTRIIWSGIIIMGKIISHFLRHHNNLINSNLLPKLKEVKFKIEKIYNNERERVLYQEKRSKIKSRKQS
jgi:hypothetical protein